MTDLLDQGWGAGPDLPNSRVVMGAEGGMKSSRGEGPRGPFPSPYPTATHPGEDCE